MDFLERTRLEIIQEIRNKAELSADVKKALIGLMQKANMRRMYSNLVNSGYERDLMQDQLIDFLVPNAERTLKDRIDEEEHGNIDYYVREIVYQVIPPAD